MQYKIIVVVGLPANTVKRMHCLTPNTVAISPNTFLETVFIMPERSNHGLASE